MGRAGLFDGVVRARREHRPDAGLPALCTSRALPLSVDLVDEQQCWFFQTGSEPLEREFDVRE